MRNWLPCHGYLPRQLLREVDKERAAREMARALKVQLQAPALSDDSRLARCAADPIHFICTYCRIFDVGKSSWIPFDLWPTQLPVCRCIGEFNMVIILKARRLGMTYLAAALALHGCLFRPEASVLLVSRGLAEAKALLSEERGLRGMYAQLPLWMRHIFPVTKENATQWTLGNGSDVKALTPNSGDSYAATLVIIDEADLIGSSVDAKNGVVNLDRLLQRIQPTIEGGGKIIMLSRPDKSKPESTFKKIYRAAVAGESSWKPIFLPWSARPDRDARWYDEKQADIVARTGSTDDMLENYPATEAEALSQRTLDKRFSPLWLQRCYLKKAAIANQGPAIPGLVVYRAPKPGEIFVGGADPAEGNPASDPSALTIMDVLTGEEVASLAGRIQPETFAEQCAAVLRWYNSASILVERNNHGHAVLMRLRQLGIACLEGLDGKPGWHATQISNAILYDAGATSVRDGDVMIHTLETFAELGSIQGSTLEAPPGQHDDRADSFVLANMGRSKSLALRSLPGVPQGAQRVQAENAPRGVFGGQIPGRL